MGRGGRHRAVGVHLGSATYGQRGKRQQRLAGFSRGYLLRRYGVLRSRAALRALVTEAIVVVGDLVISHDLAALHGRLAGWHAAGTSGAAGAGAGHLRPRRRPSTAR